jgi:hypothetical protein
MGPQAGGAVFDAVFRIGKIATAIFSQRIKGTVAEQATETFRMVGFVAREVFAFGILEKFVICHSISSLVMLKYIKQIIEVAL